MSWTKDNNQASGLIYDQAKYHFLGQFPSILPIEQAYVHIGMFFGWMLENELYGEIFEDEEAAQVYRFKRREISAGLLSELWDGYLGEELFNAEGNAFSKYYYQSRMYRKDYEDVLAKDLPTIYHVADTWENYAKIAEKIKERYLFWKQNPDALPIQVVDYDQNSTPPPTQTQQESDNFFEELKELMKEETDEVLPKIDNEITDEETVNEPFKATSHIDTAEADKQVADNAESTVETAVNPDLIDQETEKEQENLSTDSSDTSKAIDTDKDIDGNTTMPNESKDFN